MIAIYFFFIYPPFFGNGWRLSPLFGVSPKVFGWQVARVAFEAGDVAYTSLSFARGCFAETLGKKNGVQGVVVATHLGKEAEKYREVPLVKLQDLTQLVTNHCVCIKFACKKNATKVPGCRHFFLCHGRPREP